MVAELQALVQGFPRGNWEGAVSSIGAVDLETYQASVLVYLGPNDGRVGWVEGDRRKM